MTPKNDKDREIAWLRSITGDLATTVLRRMELTLPWFADMPPGRRSAVGMVAQSGISAAQMEAAITRAFAGVRITTEIGGRDFQAVVRRTANDRKGR